MPLLWCRCQPKHVMRFPCCTCAVALPRYVRHVDNPNRNGRRVTAILYLNPEWSEADGGQLCVYPPQSMSAPGVPKHAPASADPAVEVVAPLLGRLLVFFSDMRVPHEVLPAVGKHRFALTTWYFDVQVRWKCSAVACTFVRVSCAVGMPCGVWMARVHWYFRCSGTGCGDCGDTYCSGTNCSTTAAMGPGTSTGRRARVVSVMILGSTTCGSLKSRSHVPQPCDWQAPSLTRSCVQRQQ